MSISAIPLVCILFSLMIIDSTHGSTVTKSVFTSLQCQVDALHQNHKFCYIHKRINVAELVMSVFFLKQAASSDLTPPT